MSRVEETAKTTSGYHTAFVMLGIAMTPILLSSSGIGFQLSNADLIKVVIIGGIILTLLAIATLCIGEKARMPTYEVVKYPFGEKGAVAINILMAISLFGWIAVSANQFGHAAHDLLAQFGLQISTPLLIVLGCILFVTATAFGIAILGNIALVAIPIIVIILAYIVMQALSAPMQAVSTSSLNLGVAVSSVVGTIIVLVATSVDFGSFVHNRKHAIIAALLTFAVAYPLLYWMGGIPGQRSGEGSLMSAAAILSVVIPAGILMVFATFTGNSGNMFQGTLVFSTLFPKLPKWQITVALGVIAAFVANLNILSWFIPFLLFLGIVTPPVAGIYIADFFLYRRKAGYVKNSLTAEPPVKYMTFVAWIIGTLIGFMTAKGVFTLTSIPSLDSILITSLLYVIFSKFVKIKTANF